MTMRTMRQGALTEGISQVRLVDEFVELGFPLVCNEKFKESI